MQEIPLHALVYNRPILLPLYLRSLRRPAHDGRHVAFGQALGGEGFVRRAGTHPADKGVRLAQLLPALLQSTCQRGGGAQGVIL